jgi:hypothetical protein
LKLMAEVGSLADASLEQLQLQLQTCVQLPPSTPLALGAAEYF